MKKPRQKKDSNSLQLKSDQETIPNEIKVSKAVAIFWNIFSERTQGTINSLLFSQPISMLRIGSRFSIPLFFIHIEIRFSEKNKHQFPSSFCYKFYLKYESGEKSTFFMLVVFILWSDIFLADALLKIALYFSQAYSKA